MLHEYVSKWIELEREKGNDRLDVSTVGILYDFAYWLESAAEQLRAPAEPEQNLPYCSREICTIREYNEIDCAGCSYNAASSNRSGRG